MRKIIPKIKIIYITMKKNVDFTVSNSKAADDRCYRLT